VQSILEKVCRYLEADPKNYRVNVFASNRESEPLPPVHLDHVWEVWPERILYEGASKTDQGSAAAITFHVAESLVHDLETVIAVFSREICRSLLLEYRDLPPRTHEFEQTVEIMPMFFGLGIFSANGPLRESTVGGLSFQSGTMTRPGVFPARYIGYALALLCWLRNEPLPAWRSHLRKDAEITLRASLKYLEKTGDTILSREASAKPYGKRPVQVWLEDLKHGTPSRRVAALWAMQSEPAAVSSDEQVSLISENLSHHDPIVRSAAAQTLDTLGETAQQAVPELVIALEDKNGSVRMMAALALGKMAGRAEDIIPELMPLLNDRNVHVANAAAWSMGRFGTKAESAGQALVRLLRRGILHCQEDTLEDILDAILAVTNHPEELVMDTLLERDAETCQRALDLLKERQIDSSRQ
jgi:hypothetical protein